MQQLHLSRWCALKGYGEETPRTGAQDAVRMINQTLKLA
jgi:hypothetical protein